MKAEKIKRNFSKQIENAIGKTIFSRYNAPPKVRSFNTKESMTKQNHRNACDIKTIIEKARLTGIVSKNITPPNYGDYSREVDYHNAQSLLVEAQQNFARLPAKIRDRFENNPAVLLRFVEDKKNMEEAIELGLVAPSSADKKSLPVTPKSSSKASVSGDDQTSST